MNNPQELILEHKKMKPHLKEYYVQYYNGHFLRDWRYIYDKNKPSDTINSKKLKSEDKVKGKVLSFMTSFNHMGKHGLLGGELTYFKTLDEYKIGDISQRYSDRLFFDFDIESDEVNDIKSKMKEANSNLKGKKLRRQIDGLKADFRDLIINQDLLLPTFEEARNLCLYLEDLGLKPYLVFSGSKGFHINLFFEEVKLLNLSQVSKLFGKTFSQNLNLKFMDYNVFDKKKAQRRLQRSQYAFHSKTDLLTLPIPNIYDYDEALQIIKKNKRKPIDFDINEYISSDEFRSSLIHNDKEFSLINERRERDLQKKNHERQKRLKKKMKGNYKSFNEIDMRELYSAYGGQIIKEDSDKAIVRCLFHGADNNPSAVIFKDSNYFYCSSCGKSLNYYSFIAEMEGLNLDDKKGIMEKLNELIN